METVTEAVSSSSESESGSEEEKNETVSDRVSDISDIQQGSDGGDGENEQEAADDEIASAVASASQKADKFLQDSDSEVEESTENAEVSGQPSRSASYKFSGLGDVENNWNFPQPQDLYRHAKCIRCG